MNMDRSLAFTALLDLSPEFRAMTVKQGGEVITDLVNDWRVATWSTDFYSYTKRWLEKNPLQSEPITFREAADMLGVHPNSVANWCRSGRLKHTTTPGGQMKLKRTDVVALQREMETARGA